MKISSDGNGERSALKQDYLESLRSLATGSDSLRSVVRRLGTLRIGRDTLVRWAVEAGYAKQYIRTLLSRVFAEAGLRIRQPGAGPKTPREALELLNIAIELNGARAEKYLRAAATAAKRRREELAERSQAVAEPVLRHPIHFLISYGDKPALSCCSTLTA